MGSENSRKIKLLKLWELLKTETDEKHPMDTYTIIEKLGKDGINVDRKILYSDIETLREYGFQVESNRGKRNEYYVCERDFDPVEVRLLMDAVQGACFVTEKKTEELVSKISALAGSKQGEMLKKNIVKFSTVKSINERIYYSIDKITDGINEKKKISFKYFDYNIKREKVFRKEKGNENIEKKYIVNPVATVFDSDQYYLICYDDKHKSLTNYRVDRMFEVSLLNEPITKNKSVSDIDLSTHKRQQFNMFGGRVERVTFVADRKLIDVIFDKFGDNVKLSEYSEEAIKCICEVQASPMFIAWCCSFGNRVKVLYPQRVVEQVKEHLKSTLEQYEVIS
ncbi:MAG: WYL domain-containing protein [Clostridia bacterium]|nr:WYL domain-containing protein [Clostridia bacterium]